jgi:diguanylate cyclase (GGDEF)-like protein
MIERMLEGASNSVDVLASVCYHLMDKTESTGMFISLNGNKFFDITVGSFKNRDVNFGFVYDKDLEQGSYKVYNNIGVYRTRIGWFIGFVEPSGTIDTVLIDKVVASAYPIFKILVRTDNKPKDRDYLTGLPNRAVFFSQFRYYIERAKDLNSPLYVYYIDFNNFKMVNDSLGHNVGDAVIMTLSYEMQTIFLGYGELYRIGGDEFIGICFFDVDDIAAEILKERLRTIRVVADCNLDVSLSVGFMRFDFDKVSGFTTDEIIGSYVKKVEEQMYEQKSNKGVSKKIICDVCKKD